MMNGGVEPFLRKRSNRNRRKRRKRRKRFCRDRGFLGRIISYITPLKTRYLKTVE
jgi:hypothetical protein